MIFALLLCAIPTILEAWLDRKGETRKGKVKDTIWLLVAVILAAAGTWRWLGYNPLAIPFAVLVWRGCTFDYIVNAFLKHFSKGHKDINIWKFTGDTTFWWDQLVSRINPWLRLAIRLVVFAGAVWWFYI